ncbi:MAG: zf-HC2 domain-containing protein [Armatimonadetes bacterium]|nr:zf-HC2 domain-containing protein [Armatimonadota bacterium]
MFPLFKRQCKRVQPDLWDYIAERLPEGTLEIIERHLLTCKSCRTEADALRRTQNMLLEVRLEEPPTPKQGWNDLQARLEQDAGALLTYAPPFMATENRTRTIVRWMPNFAMVGSCIMLFCCAGLTYRTLSLQQNMARIANAPDTNQGASIVTLPEHKRNSPVKPSPNPTLVSAGSKSLSPKRQGAVVPDSDSTNKPVSDPDDGTIHLVPAGYLSNPEINDPAPKPSMLQYTDHKLQGAERPKSGQSEKEYIMGTLTPTSRDGDSAY